MPHWGFYSASMAVEIFLSKQKRLLSNGRFWIAFFLLSGREVLIGRTGVYLFRTSSTAMKDSMASFNICYNSESDCPSPNMNHRFRQFFISASRVFAVIFLRKQSAHIPVLDRYFFQSQDITYITRLFCPKYQFSVNRVGASRLPSSSPDFKKVLFRLQGYAVVLPRGMVPTAISH